MVAKVLTTETIRSISYLLAENGDGMLIQFKTRKDRIAFAEWLEDLRTDAQRSPAERSEEVRQQMSLWSPELSE